MNKKTSQLDGQLAVESGLIELVEEMTQQLAKGARVDIDALIQKYPAHAEQIPRLLPTLEAIGQLDASNAISDKTLESSTQEMHLIGDFRIIREIGRGGMGVVYEAMQLSLNRRVALKVLPLASMLDNRQLRRFKNEAQAAATLHHQNIVPVYAVGCERGVHFYTMQLIEGQTLASIIDEISKQKNVSNANKYQDRSFSESTELFHEPLDELAHENQEHKWESSHDGQEPLTSPETRASREASSSSNLASSKSSAYFRQFAEIAVQIAEALDHAHSEGVIHRDIKPSNLILEPNGKVWVADFGLAQLENGIELTVTGDILGTLRYMSPEQALAKRVVVDHRTDIYSLGATLYELASLSPPFPGRNRQQLIQQIAFEEPKPPRKINSAMPHDLETIIRKCMAKNPNERYSSAQDVADDFRRFLDDLPIQAKRPSLLTTSMKWCRRHKALVTSAASILSILLIASATVGFFAAGSANDRSELIISINSSIRRAESVLRNEADNEEKLDRALREAEIASELANRPSVPQEMSDDIELIIHDIRLRIKRLKEKKYLARTSGLDELRGHLDKNRVASAIALHQELAQLIPDERALSDLWTSSTVEVPISIEPNNVAIHLEDWHGSTDSRVTFPVSGPGFLRLPEGSAYMEIDKPEYVSQVGQWTFNDATSIELELLPVNDSTKGMVLVPAGEAELRPTRIQMEEFLVDQFEVTNEDFLRFVQEGGYERPEYWKHEFVKDEQVVSFEEAMKYFHDDTGQPGPSAWRHGKFGAGEDKLPVTGISWYEANAYAEFVEKQLPTIFHWQRARSGSYVLHIPASNVENGGGPKTVGSMPRAVSRYGAFDLIGNVAEWSLNVTKDGRGHTRGGCWSDPGYMYNHLEPRSCWSRGDRIGFRCIKPLGETPDLAFAPFDWQYHDYRSDSPINDSEFSDLMEHVFHKSDDQVKATYQLLSTGEVHEVITEDWRVNVESTQEELHLVVFRHRGDKKGNIVYFPGASSLRLESRSQARFDVLAPATFAANGYDVVFPTYHSMYHRIGEPVPAPIHRRVIWSHEVGLAKSFMNDQFPGRNTIYVGSSMGGVFGPMAVVTNPGFDAMILYTAGFHRRASEDPTVRYVNFLPRVSIPTLAFNGQYDSIFPIIESQEPFFDLIGQFTNAPKRRFVLDWGHGLPAEFLFEESFKWLDRTLQTTSEVDSSKNTRPTN